ncbi:MAG TPA: LAGLIDADG family homing endonuclease [Candidatus Nanoarchaeia archaeon]|nr:LAGLIDADG family homing endonuclease [Candidatus Nanoarchaeia archaeon]
MRVCLFKNAVARSSFFNDIKLTTSLSWKNLARIIQTNRSMLDNYRNGKLCISENRFLILLNLLTFEQQQLFLQEILYKSKNWGQRLGGLITSKKYPNNINRIRHLASTSKKNYVKYEFNITMSLSEKLCEFVGAVIGDGFTNQYGGAYEMQITGDRILDKDYYFTRLKPICENLFHITPKITENKNGLRLTIYSKRLFQMLTQRFKIPAGVKAYTVAIPSEILLAGNNYLYATLRGMFDTDGGVGFDKREIYSKPYIRINYTSSSKQLIKQVSNILDQNNVPHSVHSKTSAQMIQINGRNNTSQFMSKIGFSNKRHLDKIDHGITINHSKSFFIK